MIFIKPSFCYSNIKYFQYKIKYNTHPPPTHTHTHPTHTHPHTHPHTHTHTHHRARMSYWVIPRQTPLLGSHWTHPLPVSTGLRLSATIHPLVNCWQDSSSFLTRVVSSRSLRPRPLPHTPTTLCPVVSDLCCRRPEWRWVVHVTCSMS